LRSFVHYVHLDSIIMRRHIASWLQVITYQGQTLPSKLL